jgi:ABC-type transport system involved in multi-copper enzyme maturation permease subunit
MNKEHPGWMTRFWAIVRYEMLWNIRKKMFLGALIFAFIFATITLALPSTFGVAQNPYFAVTFTAGNVMFLLFAIVTSMYSLSGEYEKGTVVPLLTKPVTRTMVFLGKLFAIFIVILATYSVLYIYTIVGGIIVYGPQDSLYLAPFNLLGDLIGTFIWVSVVLAAGALSKNSLLSILTAFGLFVALIIGGGLVGTLSDNPAPLNYIPGGGASGTLDVRTGQNITISNITVNTLASTSTGTNGIGGNIIKSILYPNANVSFYYTDLQSLLNSSGVASPRYLYTESIELITLRAVGVAFLYIAVLSTIAWFAFKRWQINE